VKAVGDSIERIVDAIAEGSASQALKAKLGQLEAERDSLQCEQRSLVTEQAPELHPNLPQLYRSRVIDLEKALSRTPVERASASEILRSLISALVVYPGKGRGEVTIRVEGSIPAILDFARQREHSPNKRERIKNRGVVLMVPRGGIEPPTPAFSVQCSTN
jgi:site-specific DNA recombinase